MRWREKEREREREREFLILHEYSIIFQCFLASATALTRTFSLLNFCLSPQSIFRFLAFCLSIFISFSPPLSLSLAMKTYYQRCKVFIMILLCMCICEHAQSGFLLEMERKQRRRVCVRVYMRVHLFPVSDFPSLCWLLVQPEALSIYLAWF